MCTNEYCVYYTFSTDCPHSLLDEHVPSLYSPQHLWLTFKIQLFPKSQGNSCLLYGFIP